MSNTFVSIERVNEVENHPNADRLDIIQVLGYKVICGRGQFKVGDSVIYFPPDILIPEDVAEELGVKKYLKHAIYPGDLEKTQCRVAAARLRSVPSHGFVIPVPLPDPAKGADVSERFRAVKYEPPVRHGAGDAEPEHPAFHAYTNIENIQRYPDAIPVGEPVRITEKIHGCVTEDAKVMLANGEERKICNIETGDSVLTYDGEEFTSSVVEAVLIQDITDKLDWYELEFDNGRTLKCTEDHPVLTDRGWVPAAELSENDEIIGV